MGRHGLTTSVAATINRHSLFFIPYHPCNVDVDDSALTRHTPHADAAREQFRRKLRTERIVAREALPADLYSQFNRRIIAGLENLLARLAPDTPRFLLAIPGNRTCGRW